ncbi:hypothetical protein ACFFWD_11490 [Bradyrhizobium erythrophlei]|uniref:hypothetical protein n=1 Tax=Bradyrhizobium erythrophlei TaxID=1437360 RepID=UPI0035EE38A5
MTRTSILDRSIRTAAAAIVFIGLLSPANAAHQHDAASVFPDLAISATADHPDAKAAAGSRSLILTSRLPWLVPVGHRQPQRADAPQSEAVSAWERQQRQFDQELDRKLIICRGC